MVTIDKIVENVKPFTEGVKERRRDYERAKQGLELLETDPSKIKLEDALKRSTRYSQFNLPTESIAVDITRGDVTFNVRSEATTKRPSYKSVVTEMENYLVAINTLLDEGRTLTGVAKEGDKWVISTKSLIEQYAIRVAGVMIPDVRHTITYSVSGELANEKTPKDFDTGVKPSKALNAENFANYARRDRLRAELGEFVEAYEKELLKSDKTEEGVIPVNTMDAYKAEKITVKGVNWGYVTKTLIKVRDGNEEGELNILANPAISLAEKRRELPFYELVTREVRGEKRVYVTLESVYNRIQDLKEQEPIKSKRTKITTQEIV